MQENKPKLTAPDVPHVLLIIADSLMPQPLFSLVQQGELPGFSYLQSHGFATTLTSVFPTMSVVNDSSILTGTYPDEHRIPGLVWFNRVEDRFVNYGDALGNIMRQGPLKVGKDAVFHLNDQHLSEDVETVHEYLAKQNIPSASVNLMVHRGRFKHKLRFPFNCLLGNQDISGPPFLQYGYFLKDGGRRFPMPFNKYGYGYDQVERMTLELMRQSDAPRLLIAYLSEPDKVIHKKGPDIKRPLYDVDRFIQHILDAFPSRKEALKNWKIIVMGDSGQAPMLQDKRHALISLPNLLSSYTLRGMGPSPDDADLAVATNERSAYLYPLYDHIDPTRVAERVLMDDRIELVVYPENNRTHVLTVQGRLYFEKGGNRADPYGQAWNVTGDPSLLDVQATDNKWEYGKYRDIFRQLQGAVHSQPAPVIAITAKSGYEFRFESSPTHVGGGSHGGISEREMTVPLIVGGTERKPMYNRLVDIKPYLIDCLELGDVISNP